MVADGVFSFCRAGAGISDIAGTQAAMDGGAEEGQKTRHPHLEEMVTL